MSATDQNKAAVYSQENSASPQSPRRTTKRVSRTTTTGRQANRKLRQSPSTSGVNTARVSKPTTKRPTTRNHRFTIRQQPVVATQQAQSEANKRQAQAANSQSLANSKCTSVSTVRHENGVRQLKQQLPTGKTDATRTNRLSEHEPVRRVRRNVRLDRNKQNGLRRPGRPRQNRFAANAVPQNVQPKSQSASLSNSQSLSNQDASQHRTPAVFNKESTHTPSVIRSTSAVRSSTNGSAANRLSNAAKLQSAENRSARANTGTQVVVPLVTGKQYCLFM